MAKDDLPLKLKEQRFIHYYCHPACRDVHRAAKHAGYSSAITGANLYKRPDIRAEIDRRLGVIELEEAKLLAVQEVELTKKEVLADDFLDTKLADIISLDPKEHGRLALSGIQLAYVVRGRVKMGNSEAIQKPGASDQPVQPGFYRAFEQTTIQTRELIAPSEQVPQQQPPKAEPAQLKPPPPVIEATTENNGVWKY